MTVRKGDKRPHFNRLNAGNNARFIRELLDGPCTKPDLIAATGLGAGALRRHLAALHELKCIHVCGWELDAKGRQSIRVYALGEGSDAKKKPRVARGEQDRRAEQRKHFTLLTRLAA
jgi:hypothetical protein